MGNRGMGKRLVGKTVALLGLLILTACGGGENLFTGNTALGGDGADKLDELASLVILPASTRLSNLDSDPSNPEAGVAFTVIARDKNNNTLSGVPVVLSSSSGAITVTSESVNQSKAAGTFALTNDFGLVTARLTTGGDSSLREITLSAQAGNVKAQTPEDFKITVVDGAVNQPAGDVTNLQLVASSQTILPNSNDSDEGISLTAFATDASGNLVQGVPVQFSLRLDVPAGENPDDFGVPGGLQVLRGTTDATGTATAVLTAGGNNLARNVVVNASVPTNPSVDEQALLVRVLSDRNRGINALDLFASSAVIQSNGTDSISITAAAKDADSNVLAGVPIQFQVVGDSGAILRPGGLQTTSKDGVASVQLLAGAAQPGTTVRVVATAVGTTIGEKDVVVRVVQDPDATDERTPARVELIAPGNELAVNAFKPEDGLPITAIVTDRNGVAIPDVSVSYSLSPRTDATLAVLDSFTNESGLSSAILSANSASKVGKTLRITAQVTGENGAVKTDTYTVRIVPAQFDIQLSLNPEDLDLAGGTSAVVVKLLDGSGQPVPNVDIVLSSSLGTLNRTVARTGAQGIAQATLNLPAQSSAKTVTVTATGLGATTSAELALGARASRVDVRLSANEITEGDLSTTVDVQAFVRNASGAPVANALVKFDLSGRGVLQVVNATTGNDGIASANVSLSSNASFGQTLTVSASVLGASSDSQSITVADDGVVAAQGIQLRADGVSLVEGDLTTSISLKALVSGAGKAPAPDVRVSYTVTGPGILQVSNAVTDGDGVSSASLSLKSSAEATDQITVTAAVPGAISSAQVVISVADDGIAEPRIPSAIRLLTSAPVLGSGESNPATDGVTITAIVTDQNNLVVPDQLVAFSLPNNDGTLKAVGTGVTDEFGQASATLTTGGNPEERTISVQAKAQTISQTIQIPVTGTQLSLSGASSVGLNNTVIFSVTFTNSKGNGIANRPVAISAAPGTSITFLDGASVMTNQNGAAQFRVQGQTPTGGTPEVITASALGETTTAQLSVSQYQLDITSPVPGQQVELGQTVTIEAQLQGMPNAGQTLAFSATRGVLSDVSAVTDGAGNSNTVTITSVGEGGSGPGIIRVSGPSGSSAEVQVEFVAATPYRVDINADPASLDINQTSTLVATVRDQSGNLVKGEVVEFQLSDPTGGALSAARGNTDSQGRASVTYTASSAPSANRGVVVRAFLPGQYDTGAGLYCNDVDGVNGDDENSDGNGLGLDTNLLCDQIALTVGGQALRISLGTTNILGVGNDGVTYQMPWVALVTDSAGNPAPASTIIKAKVLPVAYQKGKSGFDGAKWVRNYSVPTPPSMTPPTDFRDGDGCVAEDLNENGVLDVGEDINGDGKLTPSNVASVPQGDNANNPIAMDESGFAPFDVTYAKEFSKWVRMKLVVTAAVDGTEFVESRLFLLPGLAADFNDADVAPPGEFSPYGVGSSCADSL